MPGRWLEARFETNQLDIKRCRGSGSSPRVPYNISVCRENVAAGIVGKFLGLHAEQIKEKNYRILCFIGGE